MTDIRLDSTFKTHRKRKKLRRLLGDKGIVALLDLMLSASETHTSGVFPSYSPEDLADDAQWTGDPDKLVTGLSEAGFLHVESDCYRLHQWEFWQPWIIGATMRKAKASKAASKRWACSEHATSMPVAMPLSSPLPSSPLPSQPKEGEDAIAHEGEKPSARTFKQWTLAEFTSDCEKANHDNLLMRHEVSEFISYWTEPTPSGRFRLALEKTWETRRRMRTALDMVYLKKRNNGQGKPVDPKAKQ